MPGEQMTPERAALREKAVELRNQGKTYSEIVLELGVPMGTVSHWVNDKPKEQNPSPPLPAPVPEPQPNGHSDLTLAELAATVQAMRLELDDLKQQRTVPVVAPEPVAPAVDQEAINLAQLDAMLGIDQPGPLEKKEAAIVAAVKERTAAPVQVAVPEPNQNKEIPRGVWLIVAFLSIAAIVALVVWQM